VRTTTSKTARSPSNSDDHALTLQIRQAEEELDSFKAYTAFLTSTRDAIKTLLRSKKKQREAKKKRREKLQLKRAQFELMQLRFQRSLVELMKLEQRGENAEIAQIG
jgi:hypothetical protein